MKLERVGINLDAEISIEFPCQSKNQPDAEYDRLCGITTPAETIANIRLTGNEGKKLTWYQHYSDGNSVAKELGLDFLEMKCLRESESYQDAIMALDNLTAKDQKSLTKFSASHGRARGPLGTRDYPAKVAKHFESLKELIDTALAEIAPESLGDLANAVATGTALATESIADKVEFYNAREQRLTELHNAVDTANAEFESTVANPADADKDSLIAIMAQKVESEKALAEYQKQIADEDAEMKKALESESDESTDETENADDSDDESTDESDETDDSEVDETDE